MTTSSICSLCSLLCDSKTLVDSCSLRRSIRKQQVSLLNRSEISNASGQAIQLARSWVQCSGNIHIAGGITSIETAREALLAARKFNASIDGSSSAIADQASRFLAHSGAYLTTLSESRSIADCLIVLGSDRLLEAHPKLPHVLRRTTEPSSQPHFWTQRFADSVSNLLPSPSDPSPLVLLMGEFSRESISNWTNLYRDVIAVQCKLDDAPGSLLDWLCISNATNLSDPLKPQYESVSESHEHRSWSSKLDRMWDAVYTSIVWSHVDAPSLRLELWLEKLNDFLAQLNQTKRAGMVPLASLQNTFRQVATWTTGFPSSIRFESGVAVLDRPTSTTESWLDAYLNDEDALLICIDETPEGRWMTPRFTEALRGFRGRRIRLSCREPKSFMSESDGECVFNISLSGFDSNAQMYRGDGVVLANVDPEMLSGREHASSLLRKIAS